MVAAEPCDNSNEKWCATCLFCIVQPYRSTDKLAFAATKTSGGYVVSQLKAVQRIPRYGVVWATPVHCVAIATTDLGVAASIVKTIVNAAEVWFASSEVSSCLSRRVCWRGCCTS